MKANLAEVLVGAGVLATAVFFAVSMNAARGTTGGAGSYELTASFRAADGVTAGTDVRLSGVKVGSVTAITLNPESYRADATLNIRGDIKLPDDSAAIVASEGLLGGNFVSIQPGGSPFEYEPGAEIVDTQGSVNIIDLLLKFVSGSGDKNG
ncbi:MAG: outer membrane lipid asymmetry maintenance protein MlaD [Deltaproteobacteria bacterium]